MLILLPNNTVIAEENADQEHSEVEHSDTLISEYTIEDENIIKEYAAIDTEGGYLEMIRFIHPNGFAHSVIKVNGELYEEFD